MIVVNDITQINGMINHSQTLKSKKTEKKETDEIDRK